MKDKRNMLFIVLKEIHNKKIKGFSLDQLSKILIELDANNYNLTPVIENLHGLTTPHLKIRLQELIIFNILNQSHSIYYSLTKEGIEYINKQTKFIYENKDYKDFIELTNELIVGIFHITTKCPFIQYPVLTRIWSCEINYTICSEKDYKSCIKYLEILEVLKSREFNIFWLGFQFGRDMEILNDNKLPELNFALKEYKQSKYFKK